MTSSATISIRRPLPRSFRAFVLILAIAATLNIALASTSPAHLHLGSSPNQCDLCFTAHTTIFESPAVQPVCGPALAGRTAPLVPVYGYRACNIRRHRSRGPPSSL